MTNCTTVGEKAAPPKKCIPAYPELQAASAKPAVVFADFVTVTDWTFTDRTFTEYRYRLGHLPTGTFTD